MSHDRDKSRTKSKPSGRPPGGAARDTGGPSFARGTSHANGPVHSAGPAFGLSGPVQTKPAIGKAGDRFEQEADSVADRVASGQSVQPSSISSVIPGAPAQTKREPRKVAEPSDVQRAEKRKEPEKTAVQRAEERRKPVQKKEDKKRPEAKPVQSAEKKEKPPPVQKAEVRKPRETPPVQREEEERIQTDAGTAATGPSHATMSAAADRAISSAGSGKPVGSATRNALESRMGLDLADVRVHDDGTAHEAADALNARAFTHGNDIWLGRGASPDDVHLMAHEATHVIQQSDDVQRKIIQRNGGSGGRGSSGGGAAAGGPALTPEEGERQMKTFPLPNVKSRHLTLYESWAASHRLRRAAGYLRGSPRQKEAVWIPGVNLPEARLREDLRLNPSLTRAQPIRVAGQQIEDTYDRLVDRLKVPQWDRNWNWHRFPFEVDHVVELQAGGWPGDAAANAIENMELLDKRSNASAGSTIAHQVRTRVENYLRSVGRNPSEAGNHLANHPIEFDRVEIVPSGASEGDSQYWTKAEIESGAHLTRASAAASLGEAGSPESFALVSPGGGISMGSFNHGESELLIPIENEVHRRRVAGLLLGSIQLNEGYATAADDAVIGTVQAAFDLPAPSEGSFNPFTITGSAAPSIPLHKSPAGRFAGYLGELPRLAVDFRGLSPIEFDPPTFEDGQVSAMGRLNPTIPLLSRVPIVVRLKGRRLEFGFVYSADDLSLSLPGLTIDEASLGVFYGTEGLAVEGAVYISIANLGSGRLTARVDSDGNFEAAGNFRFDTRLFDRAEINLWYRGGRFGGSGTLAIESPDKIRGIRGASITAEFDAGTFRATGTVQPDIPGIREAGLSITYSEAEGLMIGGTLQLSDDIPGISSGSLEVEVRKRPEEDRWVVGARGTAVPRIPGISSSISISYDDGAFDISGTVGYERGMLSGSITIGATNRPVGEDGQPSDEPPARNARLTAYGGGTLTIRIAPWLQGTAGVRLLPNGEIEVTGSIGLPGTLDIFPERRLDRNIFTIGIDIPIVGVAVAGQRIGIFANISGGLDLGAGFGPGQLQELGLTVTYNPAHEDQTHVTGGARLHIPAQAGLRLFVRGSLGVGIPIVSASAGLEIGAALGLEGALDAGVTVDWTPTRGLVLDAFGEIYVQPKFTFDITGFVLVEADLLITTIELYSKRWNLASFEYGSDLRFGVRFPVHYEEGRPFEISFDDVEFDVPDVDPEELLSGLIDRIA